MTLSRPRPRTPPNPENTVFVQGPTDPLKVEDGLLLFGVCYRAATTNCLLSWNCAGVGVGNWGPTPPCTGSFAPGLVEPGELG